MRRARARRVPRPPARVDIRDRDFPAREHLAAGAKQLMKVAVVSGANKGIGFHIARGLCTRLPASSIVYVGSRDPENGAKAVAAINAEGLGSEAKLLRLDLTDEALVSAAAASLRDAHPDGIDVLVNNAGFAFKNAATEPMGVQAKVTLGVNYFGTRSVCAALVPLMKSNGRVVNVGSMAQSMVSGALQEKLLSPDLDLAKLDELCASFIRDAEADGIDLASKGWPTSTYAMSKAAVHGLTRIYASDQEAAGNGVTVNVCCPGWCKSDMAGWHGPPKTAEEGADTPIYLALLEADGAAAPTGLFFSDRQPRRW